MFADLPLEIIGEIAGESRSVYLGLVRAYPAFARSLTLGDRLDFAEKFGYDCRVKKWGSEFIITWFLNGECHRTDGPATEYASGSKHWCINGKLHRIGGPAIERANGSKGWLINGHLHREDGPAIEYVNGYKEWFLNGKLHRIDGPAVEGADGTKKWYINGGQLPEAEFISTVSNLTS